MYQKIKAKFKANPTIFYACSIVASWAGVGSLMNFRTLAINNGAAAAIIWAVFNSLACIFFGLFAEYIPTVRRIMQSKVMFYFIGFLTVEEIGKQLGMKPEEIFRLSGFTKDEFLNMMTKGHDTYSKAQVIRSV